MGLCEGTIMSENVGGSETCVGRRLLGLSEGTDSYNRAEA
jgi:hypothetical protein